MTDAPVTQGQLQEALAPIQVALVDLRAEIGSVRTELKQDLHTESASLRTELKQDIADLRTESASLRTELKQDIADLRTESASLRTELKQDIADLRTESVLLRTELKQDIANLSRQIGEAMSHVANVIIESVRSQIAALDDKYRDTPQNIATLRSDLGAHVADIAVHVKPSAPRPRARVRRTRRS